MQNKSFLFSEFKSSGEVLTSFILSFLGKGGDDFFGWMLHDAVISCISLRNSSRESTFSDVALPLIAKLVIPLIRKCMESVSLD